MFPYGTTLTKEAEVDEFVRFKCPACGRTLKTQIANIGKGATCSCGEHLFVPNHQEAANQAVDERPGVETFKEFIADDRMLSPTALEIITSKPSSWEYRLFAQIIIDECRGLAARPNPYFFHDLDAINNFNLLEFHPWIKEQTSVLTQLLEECASILQMDDEDAFGPHGMHGNVDNLIALSRQIVDRYRRIVDWTVSVESKSVGPMCHEIVQEILFMGRGLINAIERFAEDLLQRASTSMPTDDGSNVSIPFAQGVFWNSYRQQEAWKRLVQHLNQIESKFADIQSTPAADRYAPLASQNSEAAHGHIYLLVNPSMKGLVKIGRTRRPPQDRVTELGSATGVPTPFMLVFDVAVNNCSMAESYVHNKLDTLGYRISQNREFFSAPPTEAIKIMLEAQSLFQQSGVNGE